MRKSTLLIIVIVVLALVGGAAVVAMRPKQAAAPATTTPGTTTNTSKTVKPTDNNNVAPGSIDIKNMMFTPSQISVGAGGTVTWTNNDTSPHTVTADVGEGPNSGEIQPGGTYSYTFAKAKSYQYHCKLHPSMRGTIVVK